MTGSGDGTGPADVDVIRPDDGQLILLDGAGHVCNLDRPGGFSSEVERFVESLAAADAIEP